LKARLAALWQRLPKPPPIRLPTVIVPTTRAIVLLAAAAPVALLLAALAPGLWSVAPALGGSVLLMILADGLLAGRLIDARVIVPREIEVGTAGEITVLADLTSGGMVSATLLLDPRLVAAGRLDGALLRDPASGAHSGALAFTPNRRGTGTVAELGLRWQGPLGLGARQTRRAIEHAVRVTPDIGPVRSPALQAYLRDSQFGIQARRFRGEGSMFEALAEYHPGLDRRRIDWKASARHSLLYTKEYEAERNNQIVFAFDCGQAMCEPVAGLPRIDRAVTAALTTAWVALKGGDRVALFGFAARVCLTTPFANDTRGFHRLQSAAAALDYRSEEPNFTLALASLTARLQRRSLVVVFSEFTDPAGAELMIESIGRLVLRHRVVFVTLADEELETIAEAAPDTAQVLAMAVSADSLLRQRALVARRLRQLGVEVIEAAHQLVGTRLLDAYLAIKRAEGIG
jgi:uncharacterized protein (DUF58 family)